MKTIRDIAWWYWLVTAGLLGADLLLGRPRGIPLAMLLCAFQIGHVSWITGKVTAFPVQVRVAYLVMLLVGLWPPLQWIHWLQLIGTSARVSIDYCLLARALSLAPWNRWQPVSLALIQRTFFSLQTAIPPCGEVFQRTSLERVHR